MSGSAAPAARSTFWRRPQADGRRAETVTLFACDNGQAILSLGVYVATLIHPKDPTRRAALMDAYCSALEEAGYRVAFQPHPMVRIHRRWDRAGRNALAREVRSSAHRLATRRLAAIQLGFVRCYRPRGLEVGEVYRRFAMNQGRSPTDAASHNVRTHIWWETAPVLHMAYALKAELDRENLRPQQWAKLAEREPQERIKRMVSAAESWRRALQAVPLGGAGDGAIPSRLQIRLALHS